MITVSSNYRRLQANEIAATSARLADAWRDPAIPMRQWISVTRGELERFQQRETQFHFDVLLRALYRTELFNPSILDVGAASGFYSEVFKIANFKCKYEACDYSEAFKNLAAELFPEIQFKVGDARRLPYADASFDIVLSGCVIIQTLEAQDVISEAARVAKQFVILNKTPVLIGRATTYYEKLAYGIPCLEIHYNVKDIVAMCERVGLEIVCWEDISVELNEDLFYRTYVLKKRD